LPDYKKEAFMKKPYKLFGIIAIGVIIGLALAGCDHGTPSEGESNGNGNDSDNGGSSTYTYTFSNTSSLSVHVTSSDLDPSDFYVGTGSTKTATSSKSNAFVAYDTGGAGDVACDMKTSTHTYTFSDK
jgi:hypothetical protein